jgi:hypothetical protein
MLSFIHSSIPTRFVAVYAPYHEERLTEKTPWTTLKGVGLYKWINEKLSVMKLEFL